MKLQKRLAMLMAGTMMVTSMPVWANDYSNHWAKEAIERWSTNGVVQGYEDGSFKPNQKVTRAELASFVVRVFGLTEVSNAKQYDDVQDGQWYTSAINTISSAGIMKDYGATFRPNDFATREETAHVLANAYELIGTSPKSFDDEALISAWANEQVGAMVEHGILKGKTETTIAPQDSVTRAEVVTMLERLTAEFYSKAGTYTSNVDGNVVINTKDVVLKDTTIDGNLYIAEGVGNGDVVLDNTTVTGKVIIEGGGENSIKFTNGSKADTIKVEKADGKVRVFVDDKSTVVDVVLESGAKIDGTVNSLTVETTQPVQVLSGTIGNLTVSKEAKGVAITLSDKVQVKEAVFNAESQIKGKGKIEKATVSAEGVKLETQPSHTTLEGDVKVSIGGNLLDKDNINKPITGGGSSGGSSDSGSNGGGETNKPSKPSASVSISQIVASEVAKTKTIEATIDLKNARFISDTVEPIEDSTIKGKSILKFVDNNTFTYTFVNVDASRLPEAWTFTIPKEVTTANEDIKVRIPVILDAYAESTPSVILRSQFDTDKEIGARFKLNNVQLTIDESKELASHIQSNLNGKRSVGIYDNQEFEIYYKTEGMNIATLPSQWEVTLPADILTSNEDLKIVVPIVEDTPENIVEATASRIPRRFTMSIDKEGDNLFTYLETLAKTEKYDGMTLDVDFIAFREWEDKETGRVIEWVKEDGTVNYDEGDFDTVVMDVIIRYQDAEVVTRTGLEIVGAHHKPSVPNGTERLTTTPEAITVSEGDTVTFTVTTSSAIFINDINKTPIRYKSNGGFKVSPSIPEISADGKTLKFKAEFFDVKAGARFDFYIPEEWFIDGKYRQTELIIVKKK